MLSFALRENRSFPMSVPKENMESEQSYSGESGSSSESSSGSSESEDDVMEPVCILDQSLELPQQLCEDFSVFKELFCLNTWDSLKDVHRENLKEYLPKFPADDVKQKEKTVKMLFTYKPFNFTSPLNNFYSNLRQGNYRPDIAKMRKFLTKARAKQQRHKIKSYYAKLLPEVLISRERTLAAARAAPPGAVPRLPLMTPKPSPKNNYKPLYQRARQRYFEELAAIRGEVGGEQSDDDNYPEGPPEQPIKRRKHMGVGQNMEGNISGTLGGTDPSHPSSLECLKNVLAAHRARRHYRESHPELITTGISLEDIKQRVAFVNGTKKLMFGGPKTEAPIKKLKRGPKKDPSQKQVKIAEPKTGLKRKTEVINESVENRPLLPNIKIKCEQQESDSESSSFVDPTASPKQAKFDNVEIKQEIVDVQYPNNTNNVNYNDPNLEGIIKQEPIDPSLSNQNTTRIIQPVPIKLEDLDGIDMMDLPVELADDSGDVLADTSAEPDEPSDPDGALAETTHASFLSLVRALFPARSAHRASKQQLYARCSAVMSSPIAPLNTWYSLSDDWSAQLDSALDFLAGERGPHPDDFVPYLQYMPETQMYQWIGAGRDCDAILGRLCERWRRAASPPPPATETPPPKYPTTWVIRPPTAAELAEFHAQERRRFAAAAKPFTYVQHEYRSVVGPCARASVACAGHGALLATERPRHANFLALVRDAVARLPNGEGTRHDVLTMLKMSQFVASDYEPALLGAVSSALDRLHSAKRDPMVKYDQRTAVWTYLHRHRSEEDWTKPAGGRRKATAAPPPAPTAAPAPDLAPPAAPAPPSEPPSAPAALAALRLAHKEQHIPPPHAMEMEVACVEEVVDNGSDTDVDVDDSGSPTTGHHMSSAQLLMQATQVSQAKQLQLANNKPKGKLIAVSPQKTKNTATKLTPNQAKATTISQLAKQPNLIAQATKPANLTPQAAKQASLMTQPVKQTNLSTQSTKQTNLNLQPVKQATLPTPLVKQTTLPAQSVKHATLPPQSPKPANIAIPSAKQMNVTIQTPKQASLMAQSVKQASVIAQLTKQTIAKQSNFTQKQVNIVKQPAQSPKSTAAKPSVAPPVKQTPTIKATVVAPPPKQDSPKAVQAPKPAPAVVPTPHKSPLIKQRPLQKQAEAPQPPVSVPSLINQLTTQTHTVIQPAAAVSVQNQNKVAQGTRSLLIRPPAVQTIVTAALSMPVTQVPPSQHRRGVVRVLSPAAPASGKSLISPRALMQQGIQTTKKRSTAQEIPSVTTIAQLQSAASLTTVVSSVPTAVTSPMMTRTVQLAGGRTVQLAANQTVHLPGGQAVQLTSGNTVQLSSLQLPTHSVRLPNGQTVQLASPQAVQAIRAASTATSKSPIPRAQQSSPTVKPQTSSVHIPMSTVQLAGQTVQIAGQTVQLAGQSVQLTGHTVKLPSGQSVQVASQSMLPSLSAQSVQLPSGQTVQLASGSVQMPSGQSVQLGSQTVQLGGQTVQLAGQTVQLAGQTVQLPSGQTVQLSSGQTLQLASGQTVQIANQAPKSVAQVVRNQASAEKTAHPIVAKLLTNAQGQMISLEGAVGGARALQVSGMRVLSPAAARMTRPLLLTTAKPLHNIILQQSDGSAIRVTSSGGAATSQIVLSTIGAHSVNTSTTSAPVLKLQQVNPLQQVKLPHGMKLQQATTSSTVPTSGVRSVLMDGQQLKLVGGRHVLARILRPAHPPPPPPPQ